MNNEKTENNSEWFPSWGCALLDLWSNTLPPVIFERDTVLRQTLRITVGGGRLRLKLSNLFGRTSLDIAEVHIARPKTADAVDSQIDLLTDTPLTFGGSRSVTIPAGEDAVSDAADFPTANRDRLVVTIKLGSSVPYAPAEYSSQVSGHGGARTTTYAKSGCGVSDPCMEGADTTEAWYYIADIDVEGSPDVGAIVCLGDSITDGRGARTNFDTRWTDYLANAIESGGERGRYSVINRGMGGNSICHGGIGPDMAVRFERDVLGTAKAEYLVILAGINDLGGQTDEAELAKRLERVRSEYVGFIVKAHEKGMKVYGGTLTPMKGNEYYNPAAEKYRVMMNELIKGGINSVVSGEDGYDNTKLDGIVDFDAVIADSADKEQALPLYITDGLHPSPEGYEQMGMAVYKALFRS